MNIPSIPADKAQHFFFGGVAATVAAVAARLSGHAEYAKVAGVGAAVAIGVAKELYDHFTGKGEPSIEDAIWTAAGSAPLVAV